MRLLPFALVTVLIAGLALPVEAARGDRASYERVLARERDLASRPKAKVSEAELRQVSLGFENIVRRYPTSGYADNALLKAAQLAELLHDRFRREADAKRAVLLYEWLAREYPDQPAGEAGARVRQGDRTGGSKPAAPAAPRLRGAPPDTGAHPCVPPSSAQRLRRAVRREVLPDLIRVTLELDSEVPYQHERIEGPPRLFFDLQGAQPVPQLQDAVLTWPDDVVRQIRLGRKPQDTTRVVLDLDGVSRYSVFTLYNPYRVVVDLERRSGTRAGALPRPVAPTLSRERTTAAPPRAAAATSASVAPPSAARTNGAVEPRPAPRLAVPLSVPPFVPEPPQSSALTVEATIPIDSTSADAVRLTPEQPIASRDIDPLTPGPSLPSTASRSPDPNSAAAGKGSEPTPTPISSTKPAKKPPAKPLATKPAQKPAVEAVAPAPSADASRPPARPVIEEATGLVATEAALPSAAGTPLPPLPVPSATPPLTASAAPTAPEANGSGGFSLARQLGLGISRIVIDPGHGGHDPGAQGKGVSEAELVLDVALRLEKLLVKQPGVEVVLTRRTDTFIALEERTALANRHQADLFLSIHANASRNPQARGVETYFLNFASNPEAEAVAARENSTSSRTMHNLPDIVRAIALNTKLDESRDFARMVQGSLVKRLSGQNRQLRDLGVKQAPFVVLIGAVMPSVLAEISFVTHPQEAQLLKSHAYRQKIAEALQEAVQKYQRSLKAVSTVAQQ